MRLQLEVGVDGEFDASEEISGSITGFGLDVNLALGQESDEGRHLGQIGMSVFDRDGGVLFKRTAAGNTGRAKDITQYAAALAVLGKFLHGLADVIVGAGSEMEVINGDAGQSQTVLLQRHLNLDG